MPRKSKVQKQYARAHMPSDRDLFLDVVNDRRFTDPKSGAALDSERGALPRAVDAFRVIADLALHKARNQQHTHQVDMLPVIDALLDDERDADDDQAAARRSLLLRLRSFVQLYLLDESTFAAYRSLNRCLNGACHQLFFQDKDSQQYHAPSCRPSRQPASRTARAYRRARNT